MADAQHIRFILKDCSSLVGAPSVEIGDLLHGIVPVKLDAAVFVSGLLEGPAGISSLSLLIRGVVKTNRSLRLIHNPKKGEA